MADVRCRLKQGQKLTQDQIEEIEAARDIPITFDEDSPEIDPEKTPELYVAMMKAVGERNQRVAGGKRSLT